MYTEAMNSFVYPSSHRAKLLNIFEGLYIYHIHKNCHRFTYIYIHPTDSCRRYIVANHQGPVAPPPPKCCYWDYEILGEGTIAVPCFLAWVHSIFLKYIWEKVITKANFNALLYVFEASALSNSTEILL